MSRGRIDLGGGGASSAGKSDSGRAAKSKGGDGNKDKIKLIAAGVIGVAALGLIGYQVVPAMFSGGSSADANAPELTEPEVPDTTHNVPGSVQEPVIPKPRGSAKRPAGS